jgi:hypothetical protein
MKSFVVTLGSDVFARRDIKCPLCQAQKPGELIGPMTGDFAKPPNTHTREPSIVA